jgi:hypothetical protein
MIFLANSRAAWGPLPVRRCRRGPPRPPDNWRFRFHWPHALKTGRFFLRVRRLGRITGPRQMRPYLAGGGEVFGQLQACG